MAACSSTENSLGTISREEINISTTNTIVKEITIQISTLPTQTSIAPPQEAPSLETLISPPSLEVEKEIAVESTLGIEVSDNREVFEREDLDSNIEIFAAPTEQDPLTVVSIGDSVSYDAEPGLRAALEGTGVVRVETRSFGGIGISLEGFNRYLEEALTSSPEVVTVMLGGFDLKFVSKNQQIYERMVIETVNIILQDVEHIFWIGMPPTPTEEGLEEKRLSLNSIIRRVSESNPWVHYLDTDLVLGGSKGEFQRFLKSVGGKKSQIRKVRDGKDDGHLCPAGAALIGELVYKEFTNLFSLPETSSEWWLQDWINDQRYDDPVGGCDYIPEN